MRIAAKGYISSLEEANEALSECVDGVLEQIDDMTKINKEIARTAEAMARIAKDLELMVSSNAKNRKGLQIQAQSSLKS